MLTTARCYNDPGANSVNDDLVPLLARAVPPAATADVGATADPF